MVQTGLHLTKFIRFCVSFECVCTRTSVLNYLQSSWTQRAQRKHVGAFLGRGESRCSVAPRVESHSTADVFALPAVNAIYNLTVRPLMMFLFSNVCCNLHFYTPPPTHTHFPLCSMPSRHRGSLLNKWPQFIYMVIPVRCWPRDARHIMYHHNAYALSLIRLLICSCVCVTAWSRHKRLWECE